MVHSASDVGKRRKNIYFAASAIALLFTIYFDFVTSSNNDGDGDFGSGYGRKNEFVPVFTTIAFIALVLIGIFTIGTREKWESEDEAHGGVSSAYSVFNRGGKAILGTMSAKELDGQLRGGPVGGYGAGEGDEASPDASGSIRRRPKKGLEKSKFCHEGVVAIKSKVPNERRQEQLRRERAEAALRRMNGKPS